MHLCGGEGLLPGMDPEEHRRQLQKKKKNQLSAKRSRQKHTDKADALHQQHESLEKYNRSLWKEIQDLQAELAWWSRTLHKHKCLCLMDGASCLAPLPPDCWDQAQHPLDPAAHGQHGCQELPGLFQTPVSSPSAQHLSPDLQPHGSSGFLLSPLASLSVGPPAATAPPAQLSPGPVRSVSPSGSSLLRPSSKFSAPLPSPSTQAVPPQPPGREHPTSERQGSSLHIPSDALGLACLQSREQSSEGWTWLLAPSRPWPPPCSPLRKSPSTPAPGTG